MNKEDILRKSREENEGKQDEREILVFLTASRVGKSVGAIICALLVFVSELILHIPEIAMVGWLVYFAMEGSSNLTVFRELKARKYLIWGIIEIAFAFAFVVALIFKNVVQ